MTVNLGISSIKMVNLQLQILKFTDKKTAYNEDHYFPCRLINDQGLIHNNSLNIGTQPNNIGHYYKTLTLSDVLKNSYGCCLLCEIGKLSSIIIFYMFSFGSDISTCFFVCFFG